MRFVPLLLLLSACPSANDPAPNSSCAAPNVLRYERAGCDEKPVCGSATMDLCARPVCSCKGKVMIGCDYYREPFTTQAVPVGAQDGDSCSTD